MRIPLLSEAWRSILLLLAKLIPLIVELLKPTNNESRKKPEGTEK